MLVVGAVARALGVDLGDVALSSITIQRARLETRSVVASATKATFTVKSSRLVPDI